VRACSQQKGCGGDLHLVDGDERRDGALCVIVSSFPSAHAINPLVTNATPSVHERMLKIYLN
jgi:hypothetical protein